MSPVKLLRRFFLWCSATDPRLIADLPRDDIHRHAGVGATVFFTGFLAALSGGYAFSMIFREQGSAVLFGLLWGTIIFNLDRCLILSIEKKASTSGILDRVRQALLFGVRLALAIMIAVVVARPLELRIFDDAIKRALNESHRSETEAIENSFTAQQRAIDQNAKSRIETARARLASFDTAIQETSKQLDACRKEAATLQASYLCEADGTCGTMKARCGPECERKKEAWKAAESRCTGLAAELSARNRKREDAETQIAPPTEKIDEATREELAKLTATRDANLRGLTSAENATFLERHRALDKLEDTDTAVRDVTRVVTILMIILEIAPLLTKTFMPHGAYEEAVAHSRSVILVALKTRDQAEILAYDTILQRARELLEPWRLRDTSMAHLADELETRFEQLWRGTSASAARSFSRTPSTSGSNEERTQAPVTPAKRPKWAIVLWPAAATLVTLLLTTSGTAAISTGASIIAFVEFYFYRMRQQPA